MAFLVPEINWNSLLEQPDVLPLIIGVGTAGVVALTAIIAVQWRKAQQARYDAYLKERLIERGFSPEEIISVTNNRAGRSRAEKAAGRRACCKPFMR